MPNIHKIVPSLILEKPKEIGFDAIRNEIDHDPKNPACIWGKIEAGAEYSTGFDIQGQYHDSKSDVEIRWFQKHLDEGNLNQLLEQISAQNELFRERLNLILGHDLTKVVQFRREGRVWKYTFCLPENNKFDEFPNKPEGKPTGGVYVPHTSQPPYRNLTIESEKNSKGTPSKIIGISARSFESLYQQTRGLLDRIL
jgi:hypothetical protein